MCPIFIVIQSSVTLILLLSRIFLILSLTQVSIVTWLGVQNVWKNKSMHCTRGYRYDQSRCPRLCSPCLHLHKKCTITGRYLLIKNKICSCSNRKQLTIFELIFQSVYVTFVLNYTVVNPCNLTHWRQTHLWAGRPSGNGCIRRFQPSRGYEPDIKAISYKKKHIL